MNLTWTAIINLRNLCNSTDLPFFEAVLQGNLDLALDHATAIQTPTPLLKRHLPDIIVAACGKQPLEKVTKWLEVRDAWGLQLQSHIYRQAIDQAIKAKHIDTAQHMYRLGQDDGSVPEVERVDQRHNCQDFIKMAFATKDLNVVKGLRDIWGDALDDVFLKCFSHWRSFPITEQSLRFVLDHFSTSRMEEVLQYHQDSETMRMVGVDNWNHGNLFWHGLKALKHREELRQEVKPLDEAASLAPKSKM